MDHHKLSLIRRFFNHELQTTSDLAGVLRSVYLVKALADGDGEGEPEIHCYDDKGQRMRFTGDEASTIADSIAAVVMVRVGSMKNLSVTIYTQTDMSHSAKINVMSQAVDWSNLFGTVHALPRRLEPELRSSVTSDKANLQANPCTTWMLADDAKLLLTPELPTGYSFGNLRLDNHDAEIINNNWTYGGCPHTLEHIRHLIQHRRHACVRRADDATGKDIPVAWIIQQEYYACGMLHTLPDHRRKGLGLAVLCKLASEVRDFRLKALVNRSEDEEGVEPPPPPSFAYIVEGNVPSEQVFIKAGFTTIGFADWYEFDPKSNGHVRPCKTC